MLSKPNTWFTALKHDQAAYKRKPDGSYEVILTYHHAVKFYTPSASEVFWICTVRSVLSLRQCKSASLNNKPGGSYKMRRIMETPLF